MVLSMRRRNVLLAGFLVLTSGGCQTTVQPRAQPIAPAPVVAHGLAREPPPTRQAAAYALARETIRHYSEYGFPIDGERLSVDVVKRSVFAAGLRRNAAHFEMPGVFDALSLVARLFGLPHGREPRELRVLAEAALSEATLAYYDHISKSLVFRDDADARLLSLDTLVAHELGHAYQDQAQGGLQAFISEHRTSLDDLRAAHGVLEGQAVVIGTAVEWSRRGISLDRLDPEIADASIGRLTSGESLSVVYEAGRRFVLMRYREGGWPAVADAFMHPPTSTEQLLHPAKFRHDLPTHVTLPATPKALQNLPVVFDGTVGELLIYGRLLLIAKGLNQARSAAAGWDGDHLQVYQRKDGGYAALWRILWDRPEDAQQFEAVVARTLEGRSMVGLRRRDRLIDLVYAESPQHFDALAKALAAHTQEFERDPFDAESTVAVEAASARAERMRPYIDDERWVLPEYGLSFRIPDGFVAVSLRGVDLLATLPQDGFTNNVSLVYEQDLFDGNIERYIEEAKRQTSLTSQKWLSHQTVTLGNSRAAIVQLEVPGERQLISIAMLVLSRNGRWVTITCAALAKQQGEALRTLGEIIRTLRIE
jgi:hypothetical protein